MKTAEEIAEAIIETANAGYHYRSNYPPYAITPWDDRVRWSAYLKEIATEVLTEELNAAR